MSPTDSPPASPASLHAQVEAIVESARAGWTEETLDGVTFDEVAPAIRANLLIVLGENAANRPKLPDSLLDVWDDVRAAIGRVSVAQPDSMTKAMEHLLAARDGMDSYIKTVSGASNHKIKPRQ